MKKIIIMIALIIAVSINIFGQTNSSIQTDNDKKEVIALAAEWNKVLINFELNEAKINFNVAVLERIMADDFKETSPTDGEITKSRFIKMYKEMHKSPLPPGERLVSYTSTDTQVRFYSDTAIFTEKQEWVIKDYPSGKKSIDGGLFYMVAIKRNGQWGIVFWGDTPDFNYKIQKPKPSKIRVSKKLKKRSSK